MTTQVPSAAAGLGVAALLRGYRDKTVTPTDALEACLSAQARLEKDIGAWMSVSVDEARSAAASATAQFEKEKGSLPAFLGIPFALKDIVDVAGAPTGKGSAARVAQPAASTAPIAARMLSSGGVLVGKVKTVEFAMGAWGTNPHVGAPVNPWSTDKPLVCGGSSSGSGAAVASGAVPCAVGTDTGGSVRLPAAFCGVVGLKTTKGLLPTDSIHPLSHTFDTVGPLARSVEDCALMCAAMTDSPDAFIRASEAAMATGVRGLRLACMGESGRSIVTDLVQLEAFDTAIETLRGLGAEVTVFDWDVYKTKASAGVIMQSEGYFHNREVVDDTSSQMDEGVRARLVAGKNFTAADYIAAAAEREALITGWLAEMGDRVAWLSPTTPTRAIPLDEVDESTSPATFTRDANYLGLCAITVPTGPMEGTEGGVPTSLQIVCKPNEEMMALRIAAAYETARGPLARPPHFVL